MSFLLRLDVGNNMCLTAAGGSVPVWGRGLPYVLARSTAWTDADCAAAAAIMPPGALRLNLHAYSHRVPTRLQMCVLMSRDLSRGERHLLLRRQHMNSGFSNTTEALRHCWPGSVC